MSEDLPDRYQQIENYLDQPKQLLYTTKERRLKIAQGNKF